MKTQDITIKQQPSQKKPASGTSKEFRHRTFQERLEEYDGKISVFPFEWGKPLGREML